MLHVWTAFIGTLKYESLTLPKISEYSERFGAKLEVLRDTKRRHTLHVKFDVFEAAREMGGTHLWIDGDILIKTDRNIFDFYEKDIFWGQCPCSLPVNGGWRQYCKRNKMNKYSAGPYLNSGVMLFDGDMAEQVCANYPESDHKCDQQPLNLALIRARLIFRYFPLNWVSDSNKSFFFHAQPGASEQRKDSLLRAADSHLES